MTTKIMLTWHDNKEILFLDKSQKRLLDWLKYNFFLADYLEITELEDVDVIDLTTEKENL